MPQSLQERLADIREEIQSRLELDDEKLQGLASYAAMRIAHPTGAWEAGQAVPGKDGWIIVAAFDTSPYDVGDQGGDYTFGDVRVYVLVPADLLGPVREYVVAAGKDMLHMRYRLLANGGLIGSAMDEDAFTSALVDEFETLADQADVGPETWMCNNCGKPNHDHMPVPEPDEDEEDEDDEEVEAVKQSFCGGCGSARVEVVVADPH